MSDTKKATKKKLPGWAIIPILVVVVLAAFLLSKLFSGGDSKAGKILNVYSVKKSSLKQIYTTSGTIESESSKTYYSPVTAPMTSFVPEEGMSVTKGQVLVTFDTKELERSNTQAQLNLQSALNSSAAAKQKSAKAVEAANKASEAAAAEVNKLADKVNALGKKLDAARAQYEENLRNSGVAAQQAADKKDDLNKKIEELQTKIAEYDETISKTETGYQGGRTQLAALQAKPADTLTPDEQTLLTTLKDVFEKYDSAVSEKAKANTELAKLQSELSSIVIPETDDSGYAQLQSQYDTLYQQYETAYSEYEKMVSSSGSEQMSGAESANLSISDNLAELAALTPAELLAKAKEGIAAESDGVISFAAPKESNAAAQGQALFTVVSTADVRVKIEVSPEDYDKMHTGTEAVIKSGDHTYKGHLTSISKIALKNAKGLPVLTGYIKVDDPDANIAIGATAKVTMTTAEAKDVLSVPNETINTSNSGDFVYIIRDGVVRKQKIETGISSTEATEIKSGLKEGDQVVNELNTELKDGMKATASVKDDKTASEKDKDTDSTSKDKE